MATNGKTLNDAEQLLIRQALDAAELSDKLLQSESTAPAIGFAELYAYATQPDHVPSATLLAALDTEGRVRRDFESLLQNVSVYWMPQVAAASSGTISTREIDGCRITFRRSKADAGQIFAIIELADRTANPNTLFVYGKNRPMTKVALPEARDGRIQLLLEAESDVAQGLLDIETEVVLR